MKLITAALLFLLTIPGLAAPAQNSETETPWEALIGDCIDGENWKPLPERIALVGTLRSRFNTTETGKLTIFISHSTLKGTAIGLVSKAEYKFNAEFMNRNTWEGDDSLFPESINFKSNFNIPGLYKIHSTYHVVLGDVVVPGEEGRVAKVSIDNFRISCPTIDFP